MNRKRSRLENMFPIEVHRADEDRANYVLREEIDPEQNTSRQSIDNLRTFRSNSSESNSHQNVMNSQGNMRRWSQTYLPKGAKNGKRTVRQKTINFMPSRMQGALGIDVHRDHDLEIDQLTQEIEKHEHLMEDTAYSEQLRIDTLKALPQSLTIKRQIKSKLTKTVTDNARAKSISRHTKIKYKVTMKVKRTKQRIMSTLNSIELWYGSMKEIEGRFGSGVGTYFKFLRWLFGLNLSLCVIAVGFIVVPQILFNASAGSENDEVFNFADLFTAQGMLRKSILFYGSYSNLTINLIGNNYYNVPYAYFMTMILLYVFTFTVISVGMARSYRRSFIETSGGVQNIFAHKIFCCWDFGISNKKSAALKHQSIFNDLQETLNEFYHTPEKPTKLQSIYIILGQITAHVLVLVMLAGLGVGMWAALNAIGDSSTSTDISTLYVSFGITFTILILQLFFTWIAKMEDYKSSRTALHVTLLRNYLLDLVIIGVLVVFWLTKNLTGCWETSIGQEIYRLVVVDFIVFSLGGAIIYLIRFLIYKFVWSSVDLPEFDLSMGSLSLIFNQSLLWIGLLFSPLLAGVVSIKMFLTFYIKKTVLIYCCKPPAKFYRSAQTSTLFLVMTFLSLLGIVVAHGYIITQVAVSEQCGPFRDHGFMFQVFIEGMLELRDGHWFWRLILIVTKPAVIGGILLLMCVIVYYLRSKSRARIAMVKLLKEMLQLEAKDKEFLLSNITRITEGKDWLYDHINFEDSDNSLTWKYKDKYNAHDVDSNRNYQSSSQDQNIRNRRY
ncbi:transmembrane channel-like protein 5 [Bradysia coprophila]|uniref:transmembrane channel-like protein 5 n=1 Tax=Bradysia coprophila TaxID=38358 RepID=UPI00187D7E8D|nr:transmembrane channel-like protein 5 [Bradysia coprophila]